MPWVTKAILPPTLRLHFTKEPNMQITHETQAEAANSALPQYGSKPKKPGLYLGLFHGRHLPSEQMNDWGFNGPTIGPLRWCHTTYAFDIKIEFEDAADALECFGVAQEQFVIAVNDDLLVFGGMYYGDWTVYYVKSDDCERPADTFRETRRVNDLLAHRKHII